VRKGKRAESTNKQKKYKKLKRDNFYPFCLFFIMYQKLIMYQMQVELYKHSVGLKERGKEMSKRRRASAQNSMEF
jgi:hypothetical protein